MKNHFAASLTIAALCLLATAASADDFGNKIARSLCYPQAQSITLSAGESTQYDATSEFSGQYSTSKEGTVITAKFRKRLGSASCEKSTCTATVPGGQPTNSPASCWPIAKNGDKLERTTISSQVF